MPEDTTGNKDNNAGGGEAEKDIAYFQAEAKKAFHARDEANRKLREAEARAISEAERKQFDDLKAQAATLEEQRKRREGEFDTWRADVTKKHEELVTAERTRAEAAEQKYRQKLIGLAFASASDLFGDTGKTVLTPDIAEAYFGRQVEVVDQDGHDVVVVKGADGHVILNGKTGKPASFAEAMAEVIDGLPTKRQILRGSGKTGSGSSGGHSRTSDESIDTSRLKSSDFSDPKVRQAVKDQMANAGGLQIGRAFDRRR